MDHSVAQRRAIEALRAGIPSRDAVRELPPTQADIEGEYARLLGDASRLADEGAQPRGMLLEGNFGTGKSHWLESFRHQALERGFVVSVVSVGKEGPLFDLSRLYRSCVESACAPGVVGPALEGVAFAYHSDKAPHYPQFHEWLDKSSGLDPRFSVTLRLFAQPYMVGEMRAEIMNEWSGNPMKLPDLRATLKRAGMTKERVSAYGKGREQERFSFLSQFFWSAGYSGWTVLLDEGETMGRYTPLQRLKSYANLRWLLGGGDSAGPGVVLAMTPDLSSQILTGGKNDRETLRAKFAESRHAPLLEPAEAGMRLLLGEATGIRSHTREELRKVHDAVQALYSGAYDGWSAPDVFEREYNETIPMRRYIRTWIHLWDFERLYSERVGVTYDEVVQDMTEDEDLGSSEAEEMDAGQ